MKGIAYATYPQRPKVFFWNKWRGNYYYYIRLTAFLPGQPGYAGTRKVNHSGFYWSKR